MLFRAHTWCLAAVFCLVVSGCVFERTSRRSIEPAIAIPTEFKEQIADEGSSENRSGDWWRSFGDPVLNELIEDGLDSNFNLQRFMARIDQASALARQAGAQLYPTIDLDASDSFEWDGETAPPDTRDREESTQLGFLFRWELDFFGRLSSARRASLSLREASVHDWLDARLLLSAAIAERYFEIKENRRQLEVVREQIDINESLIKLTTLRFGQGQSSIVAVLQQQERLDETKARIPEIEARIGQLQYTLDALLGLVPGTGIEITDSSFSGLPSLPEIGIPASLLQRRPDLRAVQQRIQALDANVGEAIAEQFPTIRIGGAVDWRGDPDFGDEITSVFADLVAPLFAAGERRAEVKRQKARLEEALADYADQFLSALVEVESALLLERKKVEQLVLVERQLHSAQRLLEESRNRFSQGLTDYLPVFTALNIVQVLERDTVSSRKDVLSSRVALHRALGGPIIESENTGLISYVNE